MKYISIVFIIFIISVGCYNQDEKQKSENSNAEKTVILDKKSFQTLQFGYSKDNITAYFKDRQIPDSDGKSFTIINKYYSRDKNHLYYCNSYRDGTVYYTQKKLILRY